MTVKLPVAGVWYGIEPHKAGVIRLQEVHIHPYWSGSIWLLRGANRDLVIDSGTGIVPPAPVVNAISSRPVLAIALSSYYDHIGGMYAFEARACHRLEADAMQNPKDTWRPFVDANAFSALPYENFRVEDYSVRPTTPTETFEDGDVIELGDRQIEVIHVPGRTKGSIALWEAETGILFGGETLFLDPECRNFPPLDVPAYEASLQRLATLPVQTVFGGHYADISAVQFRTLVGKEIGRYRQPDATADV